MQIVLSRVEASQLPRSSGRSPPCVGATPAQIQADLNNVATAPTSRSGPHHAPTATIQYLKSTSRPTRRLGAVDHPAQLPQGARPPPHVLGYVGDISAQQLNALKSEGYTAGSQIARVASSPVRAVPAGQDGTQELEVDAQGNVVGTLNQTNPGPATPSCST